MGTTTRPRTRARWTQIAGKYIRWTRRGCMIGCWGSIPMFRGWIGWWLRRSRRGQLGSVVGRRMRKRRRRRESGVGGKMRLRTMKTRRQTETRNRSPHRHLHHRRLFKPLQSGVGQQTHGILQLHIFASALSLQAFVLLPLALSTRR
ncbi:hypothetical protein C8F01DRAFT_1140080 [Mycena amicta]|nr:hypothetical protein C8F01DRAFT_1140080 [Mycena amicta]